MASDLRIGSIVIQCFAFDMMVQFWKNALNYRFRDPPEDDWAIISDPEGRGPNVSFQKKDKRREKRSWFHFDLYTSDQAGEVERLRALGAKPYPWRYPPDADYVVLEDPDGNLFCVVQKE